MSGDACRLREGIEGVSIFKIYRKDLRIEPGEVGKPLFDMGQEFVPVSRYAVPVPPVDDVVSKLPSALDILPPFVVIA